MATKGLASMVGHELRRIRDSKPNGRAGKQGWSRAYVAELADCSSGTVNNVETVSENATFATLESICSALGTSLEDVLCRILDQQEKDQILDRFRASAWVKAEQISNEEIDALRELPVTKILGKDPTDRSIALLIKSRRNDK